MQFSKTIVLILFIASGCFNADTTPRNGVSMQGAITIKGISLVAPVQPIDGSALQPILHVNANSVALMPYAFCLSENPEVKYNHRGQWWSESDEGVMGCIELAHRQKMAVMVKPHLWIAHGMYTGAFTNGNEKNWMLWQESYRNYILHFAAIANRLHAEILCIGTELGATVRDRPQFWDSLIIAVRQVYHGKLTYAANWDDYKTFPFWAKLDYIGVDAYFPLATDKTPSVKSLKKGWEKYTTELETMSARYDRPILFTEYGYRNVDYNCAEPWKENDGNENPKAQVNAFEAFYQSLAGRKWFAGGFVWKWYADKFHRSTTIDFTPQNKPAGKVIERWYRNE